MMSGKRTACSSCKRSGRGPVADGWVGKEKHTHTLKNLEEKKEKKKRGRTRHVGLNGNARWNGMWRGICGWRVGRCWVAPRAKPSTRADRNRWAGWGWDEKGPGRRERGKGLGARVWRAPGGWGRRAGLGQARASRAAAGLAFTERNEKGGWVRERKRENGRNEKRGG